MDNRNENNQSLTEITKVVRMLFFSVVFGSLLFAVALFFIFRNIGGLEMSPVVSFYIEVIDILLALALTYLIVKWFHIPFVNKKKRLDDPLLRYRTLFTRRMLFWEFIVNSNVILWLMFGVANAMYIVIIEVFVLVFLYPTNTNINNDIELLS